MKGSACAFTASCYSLPVMWLLVLVEIRQTKRDRKGGGGGRKRVVVMTSALKENQRPV